MPRCVIPGCQRRNLSSTHFFPKDTARRRAWIDFVRRVFPEFGEPTQYSAICGSHFETQYFNFNFWLDKDEENSTGKHSRRTLSDDAIPTIIGNEVTVNNLMKVTIPSASNMIPCATSSDLVVPQSQDSTMAVTETTTSAKSIATTTLKSRDSNYTVVKNPNGQKVCIFRTLAAKTTANDTAASKPVIVHSVAVSKTVTSTTTALNQVSDTLARFAAPSSVPNQRVIVLQDGKPAKLSTATNIVNTGSKQPTTVKTTLLGKQAVGTHNIQTTLRNIASLDKVNPAQGKRLFTVDELDRLPKSMFVERFTTKVKIVDSPNVAMRCHLLKSCPFIISCPSESDCQDVMYMHLKKHIATLRTKQEENKMPYKISTGVKLSNGSVKAPLPKTSQERLKKLNSVIGGLSNAGPIQLASRSVPARQNIQPSSRVVSRSPAYMKILPASKVQATAQSHIKALATVQSPLTRPSLSFVNSQRKQPIILDPVSLQNAVTNSQQVAMHTKQLKVVQAVGNTAGPTSQPNMTFVLMPMANSIQAVTKPNQCSTLVAKPSQCSLLVTKPNQHSTSIARPTCSQNGLLMTTPNNISIPKDKTNQPSMPTAKTINIPVTKSNTSNRGTMPNILKHRSLCMSGKPLSNPKILSTTTKERMLLQQSNDDSMQKVHQKVHSFRPTSSPLDITNEMILKAKAVLDRKTANKACLSAGSWQEGDVSALPFGLKVTPSRLFDQARHVVVSSIGWNPGIEKFFRRIQKKKPRTRAEIERYLIRRDTTKVRLENTDSSLGVVTRRKNAFLTSLGIERVGSQQARERRRLCDMRTRFQRRKFRHAVTSKNLDRKSLKCDKEFLMDFDDCTQSVHELQRKRRPNSILWKNRPQVKRIKIEGGLSNTTRFKDMKKPKTFHYDICDNTERRYKSLNTYKPLKEILQTGLIVLKRNMTSLPDRSSTSVKSKKAKKYEEVTVNGRIVKIKQEPTSDDETISNCRDLDDLDDRLLEPPSDDEIDALFCADSRLSDYETTDSESEFCAAKKKNEPAKIVEPSKDIIEDKKKPIKESDIPVLSLKFMRRLLEVRKAIEEAVLKDQPWKLPDAFKTCKICSMMLEDIDSLVQHYKRHSDIARKQTSLNLVGKSLSQPQRRSQVKSVKKMNPKGNTKNVQEDDDDKPFECDICSVRFYTSKSFEEHLIQNHSHSVRAMSHVLLSRVEPTFTNGKSPYGKPTKGFDQSDACSSSTSPIPVLPELTNSRLEDLRTTKDIQSSLNDLLKTAAGGFSDSLECFSPPLPVSPKVEAVSSAQLHQEPFPVPHSETSKSDSADHDSSGIKAIKLTLFPKNGSGLSRICFANNNNSKKVLGS